MKTRFIVIGMAAALLPIQSSAADDLAGAVVACANLSGDAAQIACFRRLAAHVKPAAAQTEAGAKSSAPQSAARDFARDSMPFQGGADAAPPVMTAKVVNASYNFFRHFTVTLDNGQVWRQIEADTKVARFDDDKPATVTIKSSFLGGYRLSIEGAYGSFEVKRIK